MTQEQIDKLEKEKLKEVVVYTIDFGSYHQFSTSDKNIAYKIWESVCGEFFELKEAGPNRYKSPHFYYKSPVEIKLSAEKKMVWKDQESALRASRAFQALTTKKPSKE